MSKVPQNLKNHARFDPAFHFVLIFVLIANLIFAIIHLVHHYHNVGAAWFLVLSIVAFVALFRLRQYPLRVQDRVIRL